MKKLSLQQMIEIMHRVCDSKLIGIKKALDREIGKSSLAVGLVLYDSDSDGSVLFWGCSDGDIEMARKAFSSIGNNKEGEGEVELSTEAN